MSEDLFEFALDTEIKGECKASWKILVVDDDERAPRHYKSCFKGF